MNHSKLNFLNDKSWTACWSRCYIVILKNKFLWMLMNLNVVADCTNCFQNSTVYMLSVYFHCYKMAVCMFEVLNKKADMYWMNSLSKNLRAR